MRNKKIVFDLCARAGLAARVVNIARLKPLLGITLQANAKLSILIELIESYHPNCGNECHCGPEGNQGLDSPYCQWDYLGFLYQVKRGEILNMDPRMDHDTALAMAQSLSWGDLG